MVISAGWLDRDDFNRFISTGTSLTDGTTAWQGEMIDKYMRWRNARAQPKTSFAPNSVIRTWTGYQTNVA